MVWAVLYILMWLHVGGYGHVTFKHSIGVAFEEQDRAFIPIAGVTDMSFAIKLPHLPHIGSLGNIEELIGKCQDKRLMTHWNQLCIENWEELLETFKLSKLLVTDLHANYIELQEILNLMRFTKMQKRSLIPAGNFLSFVLGTASMDHIKLLQTNIKQLYTDLILAKEDRDSIFEATQSITNITDERFGHILHDINSTGNIAELYQEYDNVKSEGGFHL